MSLPSFLAVTLLDYSWHNPRVSYVNRMKVTTAITIDSSGTTSRLRFLITAVGGEVISRSVYKMS